MATVRPNQEVSMPQTSTGYLTMPQDYQQDFSWNGNTYSAGQEFEVTDWTPEQIKEFRDQTGATYIADDINDQFTQYSYDNLDGISQYDFQWYGTGDQWADMVSSPELNRFYQAYGIEEGDRDAGLELYNYYDGTQYDNDGNIVQTGTGVNDLAKVDIANDYTAIENIVGNTASGLNEWNRGLLQDMELQEDGSYTIDGRQSGSVTPEALAEQNLMTFQAFNVDAANKGKAGDRETDGEMDERGWELAQALDVGQPLYNPQQEDYISRELGQIYQEPTIDPDIRPRDMWSLDDINRLGIDANAIDVYDLVDEQGNPTGEQAPSWLASGANPNSERFAYTEGSLDNPYAEPTRESFDSAISLLGDDVQYTPFVQTDENGENARIIDNAAGINDLSAANQLDESGRVLLNATDENGNPEFNGTNILGNPITGSSLELIPNTYTDEYLEAEIYNGSLSGPVAPGWTDTATLAEQYGWTADDFRVFAEYVNNAAYNYASGVVSPKEEAYAIAAVDQAREAREAGLDASSKDFDGSFWSAINPWGANSWTNPESPNGSWMVNDPIGDWAERNPELVGGLK